MSANPSDPLNVRAQLARKLAQQKRRRQIWRWGSMVVGVAVAAVMITVVALLVWAPSNKPKVRFLPEVKFVLPPKASGCGGVVALADGGFQIPITFSRSGSAARILVNVCLDGQGPFPFVVDTGAATTHIDAQLAERLRLPTLGTPQRYFAVGCSGTERSVALPSWSVAGLPLAGQAVDVTSGLGGAGGPEGLLGADVMSRFGAIRFDFADQTMTVPDSEGPAPNGARKFRGPLGSPVPSALTYGSGGPIAGIVGLGEIEGPTYAEVGIPVQFQGVFRTVEFAVDTGSAQSLVDSYLLLHFASTDYVERVGTLCTHLTIAVVHSGQWSVGGVQLAPSMIGTSDLGAAIRQNGINGLLGLDELSRFEYVIIDFTDAELLLGPRLQ